MITPQQMDTLVERFLEIKNDVNEDLKTGPLATFGRPDTAVGFEFAPFWHGSLTPESTTPRARLLALLQEPRLGLELWAHDPLFLTFPLYSPNTNKGLIHTPRNVFTEDGKTIEQFAKGQVHHKVLELFGVQFGETPIGAYPLGKEQTMLKRATFQTPKFNLGEGEEELNYHCGRRLHEEWWKNSTLAREVDRAGQILP